MNADHAHRAYSQFRGAVGKLLEFVAGGSGWLGLSFENGNVGRSRGGAQPQTGDQRAGQGQGLEKGEGFFNRHRVRWAL